MSHKSNTLAVDEVQEHFGHYTTASPYPTELNLIKPRAGSRQSHSPKNNTANEVVFIEGRLTVSF